MLHYFSNTWVLKNSQVLLRVIRGFVRAIFLKRNTLKTIELYPTFECNSKCRMCSVVKFQPNSGARLTMDDYESLARQAARMGAIAITFLGGEPLLSPDILPLIRLFSRFGFFISMVSNSLGMTPQQAKTLAEAGLDSVYFSLESLDPEINDEIRGVPGHHSKVMSGIRFCKEAGLKVGIAAVILPGQLERFKEILAFCSKEGLLASGGEIAPIGGAGKCLDIVSAEENAQIRELLKTHPRLTFDWGLSYYFDCRCPAGKEKIGITCFGDVIGCSLTPLSFGNIRKEQLLRIWNRMGRFSYFKNRSERCIAAGSRDFIRDIMLPLNQQEQHPMPFDSHPNINQDSQPRLFCGEGFSRGAVFK